jgi:hypothetical protein
MEALASPTAIAIPAAVRTPPSGGTDVRLFVSTSLQSWVPDKPHLFARDVQLDDVVFRRLDPEYFAWLRSRVQALKSAQAAGRLSQEAFNEIRTRFNAIQEQAIAIFGEQTLREAVRGLDLDGYRPPLPEAWEPIKVPAVSVQRSTESERLARARALVDEMRDQALAFGWTHERLYGRPALEQPGQRGGLVTALLRPGTRVGQVTRQWISIIDPPPHKNILRLYNPDVEQPWIIAAAS